MAKKVLGLKIPFRLGQDGYFETNVDTISQVSSHIKNLLLLVKTAALKRSTIRLSINLLIFHAKM